MGRKRTPQIAAPAIDGALGGSAAVSAERFGLLAKNVYTGVVSSGFGSGSAAMLWMSESAMLEASIPVSELVSVSVSAQAESSEEIKNLNLLCKAECGSSDQPGSVFAVGVAWPSKTLVRNAVRFSKPLAQTLGFPSARSELLISSLRVKSSSPDIGKQLWLPCMAAGVHAAVVKECTRLSLTLCEDGTSDVDSDALKVSPGFGSPLRNVNGTPDKGKLKAGAGSPLRNATSTPVKVKAEELSSAAAKGLLNAGSKKMIEILEKLAARWLTGRLLLVGNMVMVPVCGSECVFHVKTAETEDSLVTKLEDLTVETKLPSLYYISHRTTVSLLLDEAAASCLPSEESSQPQPQTRTKQSYASLGGLAEQIEALKEIVDYSLLRPNVLARFGLKRTKGVLLYGPPGTGKTSLAQAVASEAGLKMFVVNGPELVTEYYGESEAGLKAVFDSAARQTPSVVFIDELDAITPERKQDSEELGQRMIATLLTLMDGVHEDGVLVIGATNRPESIDPALRRHGRFDYEIEIGVPTPKGRLEILQVHLTRMKHGLTSDNIQSLATATHGFVGADLFALCNEAALAALRRYVQASAGTTDEVLCVSWEDFEVARAKIRPSAMREVILEVPKVSWNDIGGQADVKQQLKEIVEWPHKHQDSFERIGTTPPKGVLLYGPPGCSKTLMARAVAAETGLNFIAVKGPELFSKWVGESEKAVRALFSRARAAAPSVVFFDEIDGLAITRSSGRKAEGVSVEDRVMSQLLVELDGVSPRNGVSVIAATNRPDKLDSALLRPGRFDRLIYVGPPDTAARQQIFDIHLRNTPCGMDVSTLELARRTDSFTGADIAAVCREAALATLEEDLNAEAVQMSHFDIALSRVSPSKCGMDFKEFQR